MGLNNKYGWLFVRADVSKIIGVGHIMRCLSLASAWKARGGEVAFISHCEARDIATRVKDSGFHFFPIEEKHPHPQDLQTTRKLLEDHSKKHQSKSNWVVLDGYHFDLDYQSEINDLDYNLIVIDDYNHLPKYECDILLNQNIYTDYLKYNTNNQTRLLLNSKFALIRPEFRYFIGREKEISDCPRKILITLGGADFDNVTLKIIKALPLIQASSIELKIIIGPANSHLAEIKDFISYLKFKTEILCSVRNMPEHMDWADIAVTSGGVTCQELAVAGIPFIIIILSENQELVAKEYDDNRMAISLGWYHNLQGENIASAITTLLNSKEKRETLSRNGTSRIDYFGQNRVIDNMNPTVLVLRAVTSDDMEIIREWANEPYTRAMSFTPDFISKSSHEAWFNKRLQDSETLFFIAENQNKIPVGQVRFEKIAGEMMISMSISSDFRGCGLGNKIIKKAIIKYFQESKYREVYAHIKKENEASIHSFIKAGFKIIREDIYNGIPLIRMKYKKDTGYE